MGGEEGWEGEITNRHEETWGSNRYNPYLKCGDHFPGMYVGMFMCITMSL